MAKRRRGNRDGAGKAATAKLTRGGRRKYGMTELAELCGIADVVAPTNDAVSRVKTASRNPHFVLLAKLYKMRVEGDARNGVAPKMVLLPSDDVSTAPDWRDAAKQR